MKSSDAIIDEALEKAKRLVESLEFGNVGILFQVRAGNIVVSRVTQEITAQHNSTSTSPKAT
jgi:hypothetical protein